jgi:hypothetical protein
MRAPQREPESPACRLAACSAAYAPPYTWLGRHMGHGRSAPPVRPSASRPADAPCVWVWGLAIFTFLKTQAQAPLRVTYAAPALRRSKPAEEGWPCAMRLRAPWRASRTPPRPKRSVELLSYFLLPSDKWQWRVALQCAMSAAFEAGKERGVLVGNMQKGQFESGTSSPRVHAPTLHRHFQSVG